MRGWPSAYAIFEKMTAILPRIVSPRVQVPLATMVCLVALAVGVVNLLQLDALYPMTSLLGLLLVAPAAYLVSTFVFVRSKSHTHAYAGAVLGPVLVAIVVGHAIVASDPPHEYKAYFALVPRESPLEVTVRAIAIGLIGSAILALEVWVAARARRVDPQGGAHQFSGISWLVASLVIAFAFAFVDNDARALLATLILVVIAQVALVVLDEVLSRRTPAVPTMGPYRGGAMR